MDFIRVLEYLWKAAFAFHAVGGVEAQNWVAERALKVLQGKASEMICGLRQSSTIHRLSSDKRKAVDKCPEYLAEYRIILKCNQYLSEGFPIAAGVTEGACRHLIKERMDRTGARWRLTRAGPVLRMRSLRSSGDFVFWKGKKYERQIVAYSRFISFFFTACATTQQRLLDSESSQVQLRSIQTRAFDTTDKEKTLRTVMATLQDLGFVLDKADATLGTVSATKLKGYALRMTVTVRPRGTTQLLVRANAQYNVQPVTDPEPYQHFFCSVRKSNVLNGSPS